MGLPCKIMLFFNGKDLQSHFSHYFISPPHQIIFSNYNLTPTTSQVFKALYSTTYPLASIYNLFITRKHLPPDLTITVIKFEMDRSRTARLRRLLQVYDSGDENQTIHRKDHSRSNNSSDNHSDSNLKGNEISERNQEKEEIGDANGYKNSTSISISCQQSGHHLNQAILRDQQNQNRSIWDSDYSDSTYYPEEQESIDEIGSVSPISLPSDQELFGCEVRTPPRPYNSDTRNSTNSTWVTSESNPAHINSSKETSPSTHPIRKRKRPKSPPRIKPKRGRPFGSKNKKKKPPPTESSDSYSS